MKPLVGGPFLALTFRCALIASVASAAACVPRLPGDAHFACGPRGECPNAAPHCHGDGRCHALPADAGRSDVDASAVRCREPTMPCPGSERCIREAGELEGYCAAMAAGPGSCAGGVAAADGFCRLACTAEADCIGTDCTFGRWESTAIVGACVEVTRSRPDGFADACTSDGMCPVPLTCVARRCGRACSGTMDLLSCGRGEICGPLPGGGGFNCLVSCAAGETCPEGTECASPGGMPSVCLPPMR